MKLPYLDKWIEKRNLNAKVYYKNLKHTDLILPKIIDSVISGFNMFVIQSENRDELVEKLRENGISTGVY